MGIISNKPSTKQEPSWIKYIRNRILKKKNFLGIVVGQTGSGKSLACLSVAKKLDKNFSAERVVFGLRGLMALINSGENFPPGTVFVWDEFQIDAGNRNWQSLTNKLLNSLLSTFRHKNFILLINAPYSDFIDSQSKKLLHAEWEVTGINFESEEAKIKPMLIQYNGRRRQFYYKYLRIKTERGVAPITKWKISKPSEDLIKAYEMMKEEFTSELNRGIEAQLNQLDKRPDDKRKPLTDLQKKALDLMNEHQDTNKVAEIMNLTSRTVQFHLAQSRKKGFIVEKARKNPVKIDRGIQ